MKKQPQSNPYSDQIGSDRSGLARIATHQRPFALEGGDTLDDVSIAYELFGPRDARSIVLVCHALTGDAHVTRHHANDRPGWWEALVGPGKAIDTDQHLVVCSNVLGGCSGSTGPTSINPQTGRIFGPDFPAVTVGDMVEAQSRLLDELGILGQIAVIGGSIGGFQALEWARRFPQRVNRVGVIAAGTSLSPFGIAFNEVGRRAIRADGLFKGGRYTIERPPEEGLAAARQLAHLTYRTAEAFDRRFGRRQAEYDGVSGEKRDQFEVQTYLEYKGRTFSERFDANTYIALTIAMDEYDAEQGDGPNETLGSFDGTLLAVGFRSDWLFKPEQSLKLAKIGQDSGRVHARGIVIDTDNGHDAFLMPSVELSNEVSMLFNSEATR